MVSSLISGAVKNPFDVYYDSAKTLFSNVGNFKELLKSDIFKKENWSDKPGVYVVWDTTTAKEKVVYIGMTGKYGQEGFMNGANLQSRLTRYTPYSFNPKSNNFSYGIQCTPSKKISSYSVSIPAKNLKVSCFTYTEDMRMAPAFLEALLLQGFLMQYGKLPAANQEF
jgi:hypothetical protein